MYRFDIYTTVLVILGVMISLYITTYVQSVLAVFPAVLLISGLVLFSMFGEKLYRGETRLTTILYYGLIGLAAGLAIMALVPRTLGPGSIVRQLSISHETAVLLAVLMAVAEEVFFRGFLFSFFMGYTNALWASNILQAVLWASYHAAVYGYHPEIILGIMMTGLVFGWIDYRSRSLTPSLLAHMIINYVAVGGMP